MKKMIICVLLFATAFLSFGQTSEPVKIKNQEIVDILNLSAELNGEMDIIGLDNKTLLVGDKVTYRLQNGGTLVFIAEWGDNYWDLGEKALQYQRQHPENPIVAPGQTNPEKKDEAVIPPVITEEKSGLAPIWWLLIVAGLSFLLAWLIFGRKKAKKEKAVEQGFTNLRQPVADSEAPAYMQEVAQRMGPNVRIVGPVVKGRLTTTTPMEVSYREGTKMESFTNEPFYRALAEVDGAEPTYLYFRQLCGNDAKAGRIQMGGEGVSFVPDPVQTPELQTANQQILQPTVTQPVAEQPVSVSKPFNTDKALELMIQTMKGLTGKDNAEVEFSADAFEFKVKFSKGILAPSNGQTKELAQPAHQQQS